jgi:hypothetical protein
MRCNRRLCRIVVCAVVFCSIRATALADPVLLTFDDVAPGVYSSNLYADFGVHLFSGAHEGGGFTLTSQIGIAESDSAVSAPNILTPQPPTFMTFTDITAGFFGPGTTPLFTDFLSMAIVSTAQSPWVIRLLGMDGYLDETIQGSGSQVVSITRPRIELTGFEFRGSGAEGLDNLAIGDLAPVPEPGTLALFGVGLAGLLRSVRNRRPS